MRSVRAKAPSPIYRSFEEEVCERLAGLEATQRAVIDKLDRYVEGDCQVRGCDLKTDFTRLQTNHDSLYKLVVVVGTGIMTSTIGVIAVLMWSPLTKIIMGG